jgi:hypothetical protein
MSDLMRLRKQQLACHVHYLTCLLISRIKATRKWKAHYSRGQAQLEICFLLWESYRNARILSIRHERQLRSPHATNLSPDAVPTEVIVFRLLSSLNAILSDANWPHGRALQAQHVALYPLVYASIQITTLQNRPEWREDVRRMRAQIISLEHTASKNNKTLFAILDEAEQSGADGYDLDQAARRHGVEITII